MRLTLPVGLNLNIITLILITLLGALLRFYRLDFQSLGHDELSSAYRSSHHALMDVINIGVKPDVHPPLFQIILFYVEHWWGDDAYQLRFLSAAAGTMAIPAIYFLGLRLYGPTQGLLAAFFLAVSWMPIYYSQEARAYSLLLFFSITSTLAWLSLIQPGSRQSRYLSVTGYVFTAAFCSYLHYFGLFLVALQGMAAMALLPARWKLWPQMLSAYALLVLLYMPWMPMLYEHLTNRVGWMPAPKGFWRTFYLMAKEYLNRSAIFVIMAGLLMFAGLTIQIWKNKSQKATAFQWASTLLLIGWFVLPFVIIYLKSTYGKPIFSERNMIISAAPAYLLLAQSCVWIAGRKAWIAGVPVGLIFLLHLIYGTNYYNAVSKPQFREAMAHVAASEQDSDPVIIVFGAVKPYFDYYLKKAESDLRASAHWRKTFTREDRIAIKERLNKSLGKNICIVTAHREPPPELLLMIEENVAVLDHKKFFQAQVWCGRIMQTPTSTLP